MTVYDYLIIGLALVLFKYVNSLWLGYWIDHTPYDKLEDIYGLLTEKLLGEVDRRFYSRWLPPAICTVVMLILFQWIGWEALDKSRGLKYAVTILSGVLTWKAVTLDIDISTGRTLYVERILMVLSCFGVYFYPAFVIMVLFLFTTAFRLCRSHTHLIITVLQMFIVYLSVVILLRSAFAIAPAIYGQFTILPLAFLWLCIILSHYFASGLKKLQQGEHWYSWVRDNRLHYLVMSSYLWGWLRFIPEDTAVRMVNRLKVLDRPLQALTLFLECGAIAALMVPELTMFFLAAFAAMHAIIFILTGILFWENMAVEVVMLVWMASWQEAQQSLLCNVPNGILLALIVAFLPLQRKVWQVQRMWWWDSPYVGKFHWHAVGNSGKVYGVYSRFFLPNEALFSYPYGSFLLNQKTIHRRVGELKDAKLWQEVLASKGERDDLQRLNQLYGTNFRDLLREKIHDDYMINFFRNFNAGKSKSVCPWWLKAPGEICCYWGKEESFYGQEPVSKVFVTFREEYFTGDRIEVIRDIPVKEIIIL